MPLFSAYSEGQKNLPFGKDDFMKHNLKISVSKRPNSGGVVSCRIMSLRERVLRLLLGNSTRLTILVPGDSVEDLSISEVAGGESI